MAHVLKLSGWLLVCFQLYELYESSGRITHVGRDLFEFSPFSIGEYCYNSLWVLNA